MSSNMFVRVREKQYGPISSEELKNLVDSGEFSAQDMVYHEDGDQWVEAKQIDELKGLFQTPVEKSHQRQVIAIGGGKGGVGKTILTASLGIGLAALDQKVVIVDADLGGANLHTCMGILEPKYTFYHFYTLQCNNLADILLDTPVQNLKLISGACGTLGLANPRYSQKLRFINELKTVNSDYILLDLGAGSSYNVIDFFLSADEGIIVTTPEPMAIQESFSFLKVSLLRKLRHLFKKNPDVYNIFDQDRIMQPGRMSKTIEELLDEVNSIDKDAGSILDQCLSTFKPKLLLNMVYDDEEIKEGMAFQAAAAEILSLDVEYLGFIKFDESVRRAVKELRPFIISNPRSKASRNLAQIITIKLLSKKGWQGFREKQRLKKQLLEGSSEYPKPILNDNATICSVRCFYWDDCEYQNGGHPCTIRHLEPIFRK